MTWNNNNLVNEPYGEGWGGPWTERKLGAFAKYVWSYLTIMKKNPYWETIYFDGFAGSGAKIKDVKTELYEQLKFTKEEERAYKGAAERVLTLKDDLSFDYYYFVDKEEKVLTKLKDKLNQNIDLTNKNVIFRPGDANHWILELSKSLKTNRYAALVFLDPFGMQIDWISIESLKDTRSDLWILVPTGVIVNRLLDKAGELKYNDKLESFFGINEQTIKEIFYKKEVTQTLFGEEETILKVSKPIEKIAGIYIERMKTVWKFVTEKPLRLNNSKGVPIFHFIFASNNKTALNIAKQIIKGI